MELEVHSNLLAISQFKPTKDIPDWVLTSEFYSITSTTEEVSVITDQILVPPNVKSEKNWRCIKVSGPLEFSLTGILASLAAPLASANISIFALSTFNTDYILVKDENLNQAIDVLKMAGHRFKNERSLR